MKKITKILMCLMLCVLSIAFVACGDKRSSKEKAFTYPIASDKVTSNGGLAVKKGNYVYFVNGAKSVDSINSKKATYNVGSLMLMKLDANGNVVRNADGLVNDDYYITMSNKLCGYEATNLFISGNYLYFVSPCLENESDDETWAKERVVFNRIKLDKTGEVEEVYSSGVKYSELQYDYYENDGKTYILVYETGDSYYNKNGGNNALIRVNATEKSSKKISNDVSSVVFAENADEIFYVVKDGDDKYDVKQYNIGSHQVQDYLNDSEDLLTVKFVANGYVYATKTHKYLTSYTDLVRSNIANKSNFNLFHSNVGSNKLVASNDGTAVVSIEGKTINIINALQSDGGAGTVITKSIKDEDIDAVNVIGFVNGSLVYYGKADDKYVVKMVSCYNAINGGDCSIEEVLTLENVDEDYIDVKNFDISADDSYMYFLEKSGNNNYLNRFKVAHNTEEEKEMFGVYESESDIPVVKEETEE